MNAENPQDPQQLQHPYGIKDAMHLQELHIERARLNIGRIFRRAILQLFGLTPGGSGRRETLLEEQTTKRINGVNHQIHNLERKRDAKPLQ